MLGALPPGNLRLAADQGRESFHDRTADNSLPTCRWGTCPDARDIGLWSSLATGKQLTNCDPTRPIFFGLLGGGGGSPVGSARPPSHVRLLLCGSPSLPGFAVPARRFIAVTTQCSAVSPQRGGTVCAQPPPCSPRCPAAAAARPAAPSPQSPQLPCPDPDGPPAAAPRLCP